MALGLMVANLFLGDLNQDEGWYLYAARMVWNGKLPYIHFASTQGPVMPFVYTLAVPFVNRWGVAGGRLFTGMLGLVCAGCAAWLAGRIAGQGRRHGATLIAFMLVGVNVYQSYFCTIVKTYALAGLFVVLGFVVLSIAVEKRCRAVGVCSGVLLVLAAGTRISALIVIPVVFVFLLVDAKGRGELSKRLWLWFGIGVVAACITVFGPFLLTAPKALWFALVEYHAGRAAGDAVQSLAYKGGFVSRVTQAYYAGIGLAMSVGIYVLVKGRSALKGSGSDFPSWPLWLSLLAVTAVHFFAPFPYDDYQVMIFPIFAVALSVTMVRLCQPLKGAAEENGASKSRPGSQSTTVWMVLTVFLICAASSCSSPINYGWFVRGRHLIWWPLKDEFPLATLRRAGGLVREVAKPGDLLLTQDTYLAVESGLSVPEGLELGPFSYFPDWDRKKAEECHVLNREMMIELLEQCEAPVAAFSDYGFAIRAPSITELKAEEKDELRGLLKSRYSFFKAIENFGQADTRLEVYLLGSY